MQTLEPLGTSLDTAALHYAELMQQSNGNFSSKVTAATQRASESVQPKLVAEVLKELLAVVSTIQAAISVRDVRDCGRL